MDENAIADNTLSSTRVHKRGLADGGISYEDDFCRPLRHGYNFMMCQSHNLRRIRAAEKTMPRLTAAQSSACTFLNGRGLASQMTKECTDGAGIGTKPFGSETGRKEPCINSEAHSVAS